MAKPTSAITVIKKPATKQAKAIEPKTTSARDTGASDILNEVKINVRDPVPAELDNTYTYSSGGGTRYIPFLTNCDDDCYGFDTFFNVLADVRKQSATLDAVLKSKTSFALGDGAYVAGVDIQKNPDKVWNNFMKSCNSNGESFNAVLAELLSNYLTFGNAPVEIVRGTTAGKKWLHVYALNPLYCRKMWPNNFNESEAIVKSRFFMKRGILNLTQKMNTIIPLYRMGDGTKDRYWYKDGTDNQDNPVKPVERTSLWLKQKYPSYDHYGLPEWIGSLIQCDLEFRGAVYNLDNLRNGMNVGGILTVAGNLSVPEQKKLAKDLNNTFSGIGKGGRTMVAASTDTINSAKWEPFSVHKDGSFIDLDQLCINKIITANSWDGAFLGNKDGMTKAKSGAYLNELYQQKIKTVIKPYHRIIKDSFFKPLAEIADDWLGTDWSSYDIDIQTQNLFNDTTEASTTVNGVVALTNILKLVGEGVLPHENAKNLIAMKWGMTVDEAGKIVDGIKVIPKSQPPIVTETI